MENEKQSGEQRTAADDIAEAIELGWEEIDEFTEIREMMADAARKAFKS